MKKNNKKSWFEDNRARYEEVYRAPAKAFSEVMAGRLQKLTRLAHRPKIFRINRDLRFSKDKTPYKTNIGIQFRHEQAKDVHSPGYYLHIDTDEVFLGVGMWRPTTEALAGIRQRISDRQAEWQRTSGDNAFRRQFRLSGETLKRPPRGFDRDHPMIEDLKRRDFIGVGQLEPKSIESSNLVKDTTRAFKAAIPFVRFLCGALNLPL